MSTGRRQSRGALDLRRRWDILLVIAAGGALGSGARHLVSTALPHAVDEMPWSTVSVNLLGSFLLGLLMVFVIDVWPPQRYVRPFLGVGVLGGFTTFSTYTMDGWALMSSGRHLAGSLYLVGTLAGALVAVWLGLVTARLLVQSLRQRTSTHPDDPTRETRRTS